MQLNVRKGRNERNAGNARIDTASMVALWPLRRLHQLRPLRSLRRCTFLRRSHQLRQKSTAVYARALRSLRWIRHCHLQVLLFTRDSRNCYSAS